MSQHFISDYISQTFIHTHSNEYCFRTFNFFSLFLGLMVNGDNSYSRKYFSYRNNQSVIGLGDAIVFRSLILQKFISTLNKRGVNKVNADPFKKFKIGLVQDRKSDSFHTFYTKVRIQVPFH